jgi:hypothetical protein
VMLLLVLMNFGFLFTTFSFPPPSLYNTYTIQMQILISFGKLTIFLN